MPKEKIDYSIKFNQYKLIEYFHENTQSEFTKKIVGIENINYVYGGLCYGLTDRFLVNVYQNKEIAFIQDLISIFDLVTTAKTTNLPISYTQRRSSFNNNAHLNELFHKIFRAQINQDLSIDIKNIIHKFKYPPINKDETINNYVDRVIDENVKKLCKSKKLLIPYFNEIKILITRINNHPKFKASNMYSIKNCHDNFSCLIERINYSCLNSKKKHLEFNKITLFFHFVGEYFSQEIISKTEFNNKLEGAFYDIPNLAFNVHEPKSSKEMILLSELKKRIEKNISKNQMLACDLCDRTHAMAIIVKPSNNSKQIKFEFFDPNKGIFITKNKKVFFNLLKVIINDKNSNFLKDKNGERIIEITRRFILNDKGNK